MLIVWPKPKTINDLRSLHPSESGASKLTRRQAVRIGVIDDDAFEPEETLRRLGYDVTFLGNLTTPSQLSTFQIVLCDLRGVFTESEQQGAAMVKQIRNSYPTVYVIAYTGAHPSSGLFRRASAIADTIIEKKADIDEWVDLLDSYIDKCVQAGEFWQRFRLYLIGHGLDAYQLMILEDAFVRAVFKKNSGIFAKAINCAHLPENMKPIVEGVTSHMIAHALISAL